MKLISTKTHAYIDYIVGAFFIICPWALPVNPAATEGYIFIIMGVTALLYSLMTRYELGLFYILPFKMHLMLDVLSGVVLAASPWIFGFHDRVYLPHLILGAFEIIAALTTKTKPWPQLR